MMNIFKQIAALLIVLLFCGCGKSASTSSTPTPSPAIATTLPKGPPPPPTAAIPTDHLFDIEGFGARDLSHGEGAMKLTLRRQWNGASVGASHFGPGWSDANAMRLGLIDRDALLIWRGGAGWRKAHRTGEKSFEGGEGEKIQQSDKGWSVQMPGGLVLTFDGNGLLNSEKSANGPARNYSYDKNGRLTSVGTGPDNSLKYSYDSLGKRVTRVDGPEGLRLDYTYDDKGRLASAITARKVRIDYTYNNDGVLSTAQDQFGNRLDLSQPVTRSNVPPEKARLDGLGPRREQPSKDEPKIKQDAFGRVVSTTEPDGRTIRFEYNNLDQPTLVEISGELPERRRYNEHGMLIRRERGPSDLEEFSYDSGGRIASKRSAPAREQQYEYDAEDRIVRIKHTGGGEVAYDYAPNGRLVNESWSSGEKRHWGYNADDQLIEFVENGLRTTYGYDAQGRLSFSEDPVHGRKVIRYGAEDETTTETPDLGKSVVKTTAWGKRLAETKPGERKTTFRYDGAGRMSGTFPPSGVSWTYEYDPVNRLRSIKFPSSLTTTIERDPAGRLQKVSRGEIAWRQYRYDNAGRLQEEFSATGSVGSSKYDGEGRPSDLLLPEGKVSFTFEKDGLARTFEGPAYLISEKFHRDGALAQRTYQPAKMELRLPRDAAGRPAGVELNEVKAAYVYNPRGQVEQINLPGGAIKIGRDDAGRATSLAFADTAAMEIKYDRADRITRLEAKQPSGKALFNERYVYDAAGNLGESSTDLAAPRKFEYDLDDRLIKVSDAKGAKGFRYDLDGNLSATQNGNVIVRWGLDQMGRPTQQGPVSFTWSAAGNLESTEGGKAPSKNSFDAADRLVRRKDEKSSWSYGYLPEGDRLWKESSAGKRTWYAFLPDRLAGFKDEAGVDWLLVSLPGTDWPIALSGSNGKTLFILADRLGSARRVLDDKAAIVASADFDAFGNVEALSGSAPLGLFAGMVLEEGGLRYARQRYYDPQIARFISIDPEIGTVGHPATHNAYAYAGSNPLRYRDPLGTDFASEVAAPDSNIFNALTESQQAVVKEAWDGQQRASRVLNSPMKSTPAEMAAASRHLQECNAALARMNEIGRARYKYVLLATGPTQELSAAGKANAARNTAEAKAAMEALGEMPSVGRVNLGINAENLGSTLQNAPMEPRPISPSRALVPSGGSGMSEAGTASRGAGAGAGSSSGGASTGWDENLFTGKSPINKSGRIPGQVDMVYDPKYGGYRPAVPSGSASSFAGAVDESGRWLGPKVLNAGGKVLNALGPVLKVMTAIDAARLGGTMAKNFTDNLNQPFKENQAINQAARDMANDLAKRLGELAASDPNAIILGDGRKFDPNNPNDIDEVISTLGQNIYMGRKPFDGILKYIPKLDPNVLPKTYMGAADGDTALATTLASARKLFATGWTARGVARDARAELAKQEAEAQAQLESAMTTAGVRAVAESDLANVPVKAADLKTLTAAVQAQMKALEAANREMQAAITAGDHAATKICDYAARAASASAGEIALWRKEATNDLGNASNLLNGAQVKLDGADNSIDQLASAIGVLEGLKTKLAFYQGGSVMVEKADVSPDAALAAAKAAAALAETARTKLTTALGEIGGVVPKMTGMLSPYIATDMDAATLAGEALDLADGISEPGLFNFAQLLSAALPVIDAAIANQKAVEKAISGVNLDSLLTAAREALTSAQTQRSAPSAIPSGPERYRSLQTASQCFALINVAPKVAEVSPTPTPAEESPTPDPTNPTPGPTTAATASPAKPLEVIVPDVSGFDTPGAMKAAAGPDMVGVIHATKIAPPEGSTKLFAYQEPAANSTAIRGEPLHIYIYQSLVQPPSSSPSPTPDDSLGGMPNLLGLTLDQATSRLTSNMSIGGDEVGDKPPTPEKAYTIFSQNPAPGSSVAPNKKVVVTVKRYGSAKTSEEPAPTPYEEQPSGSPGAGGFEGTWGGNLTVQGSKPTYLKVDVRKQGDVYMIYSGKGKPVAMQAQGNVLVYDSKLDFSGILGPNSKDTDPFHIRVTATLVGDELQVYMKGSSKKERKEGPLGTLKRLQ